MWREKLLSEEPSSWLGILAKSSLVSECGESLCEVKIACLCNKSWVLLPFLTILDSLMVEWEIAWLIVCIWREIRVLMSVWLASFSFGKNALYFWSFLLHSWDVTCTRGVKTRSEEFVEFRRKNTANLRSNKMKNIFLWMPHQGELWCEIVDLSTKFPIIWLLVRTNSRHWALKANSWFLLK